MPGWLRWLERLLLRGADREFVEGDLQEEFARRLRDHGRARAVRQHLRDLLHWQAQRTVAHLSGFRRDARFAVRMLARRPAFALAATLTLGLGIGATTALFSVADAVLIARLPYADADRLLFVSSSFPGATGGGDQLSFHDVADIARRATTLDGVAAYHTGRALQMRSAQQPERVRANIVEPGYLTLLGARAARGRLFTEEDGRTPGGHPFVILSHAFWTTRLAADPEIIGRQLVLSDVALTVVGVLEEGFRDVSAEEGFAFDSDVFIPAMMVGSFGGATLLTDRVSRNVWALAKVKAGYTVAQASEEIAAIGQWLQDESPSTNRGFSFWAERLDVHLARDIRGPILLLLAGSAFVLLIACANVANLMLAHVSARVRELSIRRAIGASRLNLVALLGAEAAVLAAAGGVAGVLIASATNDLVGTVVPGELTPRLANAGLNPRVLAFCGAVTVGVAALLALLAAVRLSRGSLLNPMRDSTRATDIRGRGTRRALLVAEVATALMLLVGANLMVASLGRLQASDFGFRTERLVTLEMDLRSARYTEQSALIQFGEELRQRLEEAPGVEAAMIWGPGRPGRNTWVTFPGREDATQSSERMMTWRHTVTPGALEAIGQTLVAGREFGPEDTRLGQPVVIVSETIARTLWPGEDPIGKRMKWRTDAPTSPILTVVGVVADAKHRGRIASLLYPARDIYVPFAQRNDRTLVIVVRASHDTTTAISSVRDVVRRLDPDLPLFNVQTMAQHMATEEAETRFAAWLMSAYATLALALAAMGVYGVLSYHVSLRARELAVRMALGARRGDVLRMVVADGVRPTVLGVVVGTLGALVLGRFVQSLLFEVRPHDPAVFVTVVSVLLAVALLATLVPAARATRAEPVQALRAE